MSEYLVLSHTHSLLPFAHRLKKEGQKVHPVVVVRQFEAAWHGELLPSLRSTKDKGALDETFITQTFAQAKDEGWIVLTDNLNLHTRACEEFGIPDSQIFGRCIFHEGEPTSVIRVGGWFDGEVLSSHFGMVVDRGAWHGGLGPDVDGSLTLVRMDDPQTIEVMDLLVAPKVEELKSRGFQGLVQFGLEFETQSGGPEVKGVGAGWPFLVSHGFFSESSLTPLLDSHDKSSSYTPDPVESNPEASDPTSHFLPQKFVTVIPLSRPPWPTQKARFRFQTELIEGLTSQQMGRIFWHDVQIDQKAGQLRTAGLDGLVGVVRGSANTTQLAVARALEVAARLQMPEKQYRTDAGSKVQMVLSMLEEKYGILL